MSKTPFGDRLASRAEAAHLSLDPRDAVQLTRYFERLRQWNRTINLTALPLDPPTDDAIDRLFIEPLAAARVLADDTAPSPLRSVDPRARTWVDLGSGGGSPAIPMKIVIPSVSVTLVESKSRKAAFLREAVRSLGLEKVFVENIRFEQFRCHPPVDLVTVRAVRVDADLARVAASLLDTRGRLVVFQRQAGASGLPGFESSRVEQLLPERNSWLHIYDRLFHVEH